MFRRIMISLHLLLALALTAPFVGAEDGAPAMDQLLELPGFDPEGGQECIQFRQISGTTILGDQAIEFRLRNGDRFVNILPSVCPALKPGRTVKYESAQTRLCKVDFIEVLIAFSSGFRTMGRCALGKFHPLPEELPAADDESNGG